jgi:hypothetical protein
MSLSTSIYHKKHAKKMQWLLTNVISTILSANQSTILARPGMMKLNFKCQKCDQIFVKKNLLSDHIKGKHGEGLGKYRYEVCSKAFRYRSGRSN